MIVFGILFFWAFGQAHFVMAYPQVPVESDIYMELSQAIKTATENSKSKDHVLKLQYPAVKYVGLGGGHVHDWYGLHINQLFYPAMLKGIGVDLCLIWDT